MAREADREQDLREWGEARREVWAHHTNSRGAVRNGCVREAIRKRGHQCHTHGDHAGGENGWQWQNRRQQGTVGTAAVPIQAQLQPSDDNWKHFPASSNLSLFFPQRSQKCDSERNLSSKHGGDQAECIHQLVPAGITQSGCQTPRPDH